MSAQVVPPGKKPPKAMRPPPRASISANEAISTSGARPSTIDLARAVRHQRGHLPGLEELGEVARPPGLPDAARPVGVFLDEPSHVGRLLDAVDDVGGLAVGGGAAADDEALPAQLRDPVEVRRPVRPAALEVVVGGGEADVADDHGVTQPPENGTTCPTKKSASSEARYTASLADSSLRASLPAGMFLTIRASFCGSLVSDGGK